MMASPLRADFTSLRRLEARTSGTSPFRTRTVAARGILGSACISACPVPSRRACSTHSTAAPSNAAGTPAPPCP
jgi:hypothetical protein